MNYLELGTGVPAVFVHGSFGWGLDTFPAQQQLADEFRIILVDRAGFGDTPARQTVGWPTDVHDVIEVLQNVQGAHLVGQSYGAVVSLLVASERPDLVKSLVVIEPPLYTITAGDPDVAVVLRGYKDVLARSHEMTTQEFVGAWATQVLGSDQQSVSKWTGSWTEKDWAAAESTRKERWPADAPVQFSVLQQLAAPKVVAVGEWKPELFPGRETAGRALRGSGRARQSDISSTCSF
jgi:pimeloyl-ACP methyl ester carboxylesterase